MTDNSQSIPLADIANYNNGELIDLIDQVVVANFEDEGETATVVGTLALIVRSENGIALKFADSEEPVVVPAESYSGATLSIFDVSKWGL